MSRSYLYNIIFFLIAGSIFSAMIYNKSYNDRLILGTWKEKSWEYEKVDLHNSNIQNSNLSIDQFIKQEVVKDLIIHKGEVWEFLPGNILKIHIDNEDDVITTYKFKGRGHILKIIHEGEVLELYTISKISQKEMVLNFYCETQARGIVKLTFEKLED